MADETLVEALEKAGVGTYSAEYRGMVARDAEAILKVSARFASPEAKREVLATLLRERLESLGWTTMNMFATQLGYQLAADYEDDCPGARQEFLNFLAPLEAP